MPQFIADRKTATLCFRKYDRKGMFWIIGLAIFIFLEVSASYFRFHRIGFTVFYILVCLLLWGVVIYIVYKAGIFVNHSIEVLEVNDNTVLFRTFDASVFLGLVKRRPIEVIAPKNLVNFDFTNPKRYGFDKKLTGSIFLVTYAGDEYFLQSSFFQNFDSLKGFLQSDGMQT